MSVQCYHCRIVTAALVPAPHAGSIGRCPGCNRVLTRWFLSWFDVMGYGVEQEILRIEDREFVKFIKATELLEER